MTNQPEPASRQAREDLARWARHEVLAAVQRLVREAGGQFVTRPMFSSDPDGPAVRDAEPIAGLGAARAAELAARRLARGYARAAREDGRTWQEIGAALGLLAGGDDGAGDTIAEAAFSYAAGAAGTDYDRSYGRSFAWRCRGCGGLVSDRGPFGGPVDDEPGHADNCERHAADVAAWDASWAEPDEESQAEEVAGSDESGGERFDFAGDITRRARRVRDHNRGRPEPAWSTGERIAVALVLNDQETLNTEGYTRDQAAQRLAGDLASYGYTADTSKWLAQVRAALGKAQNTEGGTDA